MKPSKPLDEFDGRFSPRVWKLLTDAGWHAGRSWESEELEGFLKHFDKPFPPAVIRVLSEFGGLDVGGLRGIIFGFYKEHLCHSLPVLETLLGEPLHLIGQASTRVAIDHCLKLSHLAFPQLVEAGSSGSIGLVG